MIKFGLIAEEKDRSYTTAFLRFICRKNNIPLCDPEDADIILLSMCDVDDFPKLIRAKKYGKPIVMGGQEAFNDKLYENLVDAICVGEGFEFFYDTSDLLELSTDNYMAEILKKSYMLSKHKLSTVYPSYKINWNDVPIIKVGANKKMYLTGRGCHRKCKYCFTSWTTKYQTNPNKCTIDKNVMMISNDNATEDELNTKAYVRSITLKSYLGMTKQQASMCRKYRMGIESFSYETRKFFGKGDITNENLVKALRIAKQLKHDITIFIIAGIDDESSVDEFLYFFGQDPDRKPSIEVKATYFNPCQHTPLKDYDINNLYLWDKRKLFMKLRQHSPRFLLTMCDDNGDAIYRTAIHRALTEDEAVTIYKNRNKKGSELLDLINQRNFTHMLDKSNPTRISF